MRVMSFNIRGSFHDDGDNDWPKRRDLNIATIQKYNPDIIGFQEAQSGNLADYANELPEYAYNLGPVAVRKADDHHHVPIFWRRERYALVNSGGFYLSETPDVWSIGWGATFARSANWVTLLDMQTNREFSILNTHFPHMLDQDETRANCAAVVVEKLAPLSRQMPVIVMADFNAIPSSAAYGVFMEAGYVDSYTAAGHTEDVNTFHGFHGREVAYNGLRIDWILTKGAVQTSGFQVITDEAPPIYPSDHYPILTELDFA